MPLKFALITEGVFEHRIIKHILQRYCQEEPEINQIQPQLMENKQVSTGGWNEVLHYCEHREKDLLEILKFNDYIVVQIDTDMCQTSPYNVSKIGDDGKLLPEQELWHSVKTRLLNALPMSVPKERIIFAICIDMIECWLLPVYASTPQKACRTTNCLNHLNQELLRNNIHIIKDKNSETSRNTYAAILKSLRKRKDIEKCAFHHYGFSKFLETIFIAEIGN